MIKIVRTDVQLLSSLLNSSKEGIKKFRYFNTRHLEITQSHLQSFIILENNIPAAYCHLEEENNKIWLGILVSDSYIGKHLGSYCMDILINISKVLGIKDIYLSVDKDNYKAINLYKKYNFFVIEEKELLFIMKWSKNV